MDLLSEILLTLRLRGNLYFRTDLGAPWGIQVPADGKVARFHVVIRGSCWLRVEGESEPSLISEGDLAIVPHGSAHQLVNSPETPCRSLQDVLAEQPVTEEGLLHYGGDGERTSLVCGYFSFDDDIQHPLLESLPIKIHIKGSDNKNFLWLDTVLRFISDEAGTGALGSRAIADRLSEILFIQVIRACAAKAPDEIVFLAAMEDEKLSRALKHIHSEPEKKWTLDQMARVAGMSRSIFAERFNAVMKLPPAEYLARWRMLRAKAALDAGKETVARIAAMAGYRSEAAFSTAFKRRYNYSPGRYRRRG